MIIKRRHLLDVLIIAIGFVIVMRGVYLLGGVGALMVIVGSIVMSAGIMRWNDNP